MLPLEPHAPDAPAVVIGAGLVGATKGAARAIDAILPHRVIAPRIEVASAVDVTTSVEV